MCFPSPVPHQGNILFLHCTETNLTIAGIPVDIAQSTDLGRALIYIILTDEDSLCPYLQMFISQQ